jgi:RNA polymerase sigma-70 factor (ECF subfamily)
MDALSVTHATLLARLAGGAEPAAWQDFLARYGDLIRSFGRRQGLQPADCDDALQDVLLILTRSMPGFSYDPTRGKFRSYLKTITLHAIYKRRLKNRGGVTLEAVDEATRLAATDDAVEQDWETEWRSYHVRQAMRTIAVEFNGVDRRAFERYAMAGGDAASVASECGLSVDQVYQAKSRIMKRLTQLVEAQVLDEG